MPATLSRSAQNSNVYAAYGIMSSKRGEYLIYNSHQTWCGPTKVSHLSEAFKAITIKLSPGELADLSKALGAASDPRSHAARSTPDGRLTWRSRGA